jgi:thioesterase domain-containing protein
MSIVLRIQELLYRVMPITRAMGVVVESYDGARLVLTAPLEANVNHLGTAFGGSINTLAVLSGYGLLWIELEDTECHLVLRESAISYERPVRVELRAVCVRPEAEALDAFRERFREKGRARIALDATVEEDGRVAARFRGTFVAMR